MQPPSNPAVGWLKKYSAWHLPVILLVALALRLGYFGWAQSHALGYQVDGIEAYEVAANFENGGERALYIGQPNCNPHSKLPGPLWTLFCVAGLKLYGSLDGVVLLMIAVNLAAIALTWRLARELVGVTAASFGALFMAVSLWMVQYSSIVWNPSPMPLLGAVIFLALFRCVRIQKSRAIFLLPLLLLAGAQFHMSTLSLILPLIAFGWFARLCVNWCWLVIGLLAAAASYVPYVLGDARHDWANTRGMLTGGNGGFSPDALKIFSSPFTFLVNFWNPGWTYAPGDFQTLAQRAFGGVPALIAVNAVSVIFALGILLGAILAVKSALKNRSATLRETLAQPPGLLTAAFVFLAYLAFSFVAGKPFHSRYCLLISPLLFTLAGVGAARCLELPWLKKIFLPALLVTVAADLWFMPVICKFEGDRIANGPIFVPSCAKMNLVYQQLKARAAGRVEVRDADYIAAVPPGEKNNIFRHARLISHYVKSRELELQAAGALFSRTNFFELRAATLVNSNDSAVTFYGNGIALVAVPQ